jgi:peptide/nickel transport system substrate-binding protein
MAFVVGVDDRLVLDRRRILKGGVVLGAGLLGSSWISSVVAEVNEEKNLVVISGADISTFSPFKTNAIKDVAVQSAVVDRFVRASRTSYTDLQPRLAMNIESVKPDRWRLNLREGVKFHNGAEFNAETAKWNVEYFAANALGKSIVSAVDHVDVVDKHTIEIVTKYPTALLPLMLNCSCEQVDPAWMQSSDYSDEKLVGTGIARVAEWVKGQYVVLEKNPDFWGGPVSFEKFVTRAVAEAATRANAALANEGDIVRNILSRDAKRFEGNTDVSVRSVESNRCAHFRFREDIKPFDDKRVRQAMNYAVDMEGIVTNVLDGFGTPVQGQLQGKQARYWQESVKAYPYDPDKARALLAEAGFPNGFDVKMGTSRGRDQGDFEFSAAVAGQLREVGVNVDLIVHEPGVYQAKYAGQEPAEPIFYWSSGNMIPDAENSYRDVTYARAGLEVKSPEFLALFEKVKHAIDPTERQAATLAATTFLNDYCPVIFGYQLVQSYAVANRIKWEPRPDEYIYLEEISMA